MKIHYFSCQQTAREASKKEGAKKWLRRSRKKKNLKNVLSHPFVHWLAVFFHPPSAGGFAPLFSVSRGSIFSISQTLEIITEKQKIRIISFTKNTKKIC